MDLKSLAHEIIHTLREASYDEFALGDDLYQEQSKNKLKQIVEEKVTHLEPHFQQRVYQEFFELGPITTLIGDSEITEIIINGPESIYFEKKGTLHAHIDHFYSTYTFENFVNTLGDNSNCIVNLDSPFADGKYKNFRVSFTDKSITQSHTSINLRRHPLTSWSFDKLITNKWCDLNLLSDFQQLIEQKKNFLIIGATGCGKTSVLNAFLNLTLSEERSLIIEDTPEISLPNNVSSKLLTKSDPNNLRPETTQTDLVKRALRLRPDRIIMGEIRGSEAKDFLMALSTGHLGSFGTLHASDPHQALIRLEMLIQMGAPQWSLSAIRRLIFLSLDMIVVVGKNHDGSRQFKGAYQLCSLEDHGFLLERKF